MPRLFVLTVAGLCGMAGWYLYTSSSAVMAPGHHDDDMPSRPSAALEHADSHVSLKVLPSDGLPAFILSAGSKDAFDRFIFARQGASAQQAKNAYQQYSQSTFSEHTAGYASDVFERYVDYKVALSQQNLEVPGSGAAIQDIADTLDARQDLRRRFFDEHEYIILFADEAAEDDRALSRLRIAGDPGLTARQKKQQIFEQIDALDEQQQAGFLPTLKMHKVAQIKQQFADDTSRYNALAALIGNAPAQRMVATWHKQTQWQARVEQYRDYRETLRQQRLDTHMHNTLLDEYQRTHFSTNERKRLHVVMGQ